VVSHLFFEMGQASLYINWCICLFITEMFFHVLRRSMTRLRAVHVMTDCEERSGSTVPSPTARIIFFHGDCYWIFWFCSGSLLVFDQYNSDQFLLWVVVRQVSLQWTEMVWRKCARVLVYDIKIKFGSKSQQKKKI
jgi:hypothetical protein